MQAPDGTMVELKEKQHQQFMNHGSTNILAVGEVFKVRGCYFEVDNITPHGMFAKGISKREYHNKRKLKSSRQ